MAEVGLGPGRWDRHLKTSCMPWEEVMSLTVNYIIACGLLKFPGLRVLSIRSVTRERSTSVGLLLKRGCPLYQIKQFMAFTGSRHQQKAISGGKADGPYEVLFVFPP